MSEAPGTSGSNIYDLGYRRYEGARLGRRHAIMALYIESLRGAFGLGRSAAAKVAPALLVAFATVPALVQLIVGALVPLEADLVPAEEYYGVIKYLLALYCAVVAPDIAGRDQRNRSLTLYFSRAISRSDYAFGKLAAMTTAMLLVTLLPQAVLFSANALTTQDFGGYLLDEWPQVLAIVGSALLGSALIASIGVAIAAYTPHRAFATVGIVVAFILPLVVAAIMVIEINTDVTRAAVFLSPMDIIDGATLWIFGAAADSDGTVGEADFLLWSYVIAAAALIAISTFLLVRRYRTVQA